MNYLQKKYNRKIMCWRIRWGKSQMLEPSKILAMEKQRCTVDIRIGVIKRNQQANGNIGLGRYVMSVMSFEATRSQGCEHVIKLNAKQFSIPENLWWTPQIHLLNEINTKNWNMNVNTKQDGHHLIRVKYSLIMFWDFYAAWKPDMTVVDDQMNQFRYYKQFCQYGSYYFTDLTFLVQKYKNIQFIYSFK